MSESRIETRNGNAVGFIGPDATNLFRAVMLRASIKLYAETGMKPTRGVGMRQMLDMASGYSGKLYKGKADLARAAADLDIWINAMKSALPTVERG